MPHPYTHRTHLSHNGETCHTSRVQTDLIPEELIPACQAALILLIGNLGNGTEALVGQLVRVIRHREMDVREDHIGSRLPSPAQLTSLQSGFLRALTLVICRIEYYWNYQISQMFEDQGANVVPFESSHSVCQAGQGNTGDSVFDQLFM